MERIGHSIESEFAWAVTYVTSMEGRGWRLGLDRMQEFIRRANLTDATGPTNPKFIHVAGTNGKGSVCAISEALIEASGLNAGGYYSPYVYDLRERIRINNENVSQEDFVRGVNALKDAAQSFEVDSEFGQITQFEFKTALGFRIWKDLHCDVVALEVGLGGRLDATNVVSPASTAIVSIGLDHTQILGKTLAKIAQEKAGIIKEGTPCIIGQMAPEAFAAIEEVARALNADLWRIEHEIKLSKVESETFRVELPTGESFCFVPPALGSYSAHNAAIAIACVRTSGVELSQDAVELAMRKATIPARFEMRVWNGVTMILDGAHNGPAIESLFEYLTEKFPQRKIHVVAGMLEGHEPSAVFGPISKAATSITLSPIDFFRAVSPIELQSQIKELFPQAVTSRNTEQALETAYENAQTDNGIIVVTGSYYLVGDVGRHLGSDH